MSEIEENPLNDSSEIEYSICVANFNMADTLEQALTSVLGQLDHRFEVVVVDDGSSDGSVAVLDRLANRFPFLRYISLPRSRKRLLGETRNIGIRAARGKYILLHIDADDVWEPYIKDFVAVFHRIERCVGRDIYLQGQQIGIGRKLLTGARSIETHSSKIGICGIALQASRHTCYWSIAFSAKDSSAVSQEVIQGHLDQVLQPYAI